MQLEYSILIRVCACLFFVSFCWFLCNLILCPIKSIDYCPLRCRTSVEYKNTIVSIAVSMFCFVCVSTAPKIVIWLHRHVQCCAAPCIVTTWFQYMKTFECGHACEFYVYASLSPPLGLCRCVVWFCGTEQIVSMPAHRKSVIIDAKTVWRTRNVCYLCILKIARCFLILFFFFLLLFSFSVLDYFM